MFTTATIVLIPVYSLYCRQRHREMKEAGGGRKVERGKKDGREGHKRVYGRGKREMRGRGILNGRKCKEYCLPLTDHRSLCCLPGV